VHTLTSPFYVRDEVVKSKLIKRLGEKKGKPIYEQFEIKMRGRTRMKDGIYMQDIREILSDMSINACFVNEKNEIF
jgi:hypothetical protein